MTPPDQLDRSPAPGIIPEPTHVHHHDTPSIATSAMLSSAERLTAERTERRRQRAVIREAPTRPPRGGRRRERPTESQCALTPPRRPTLSVSVSVTLIAVLAAGGVVGVILGAVSSSWVTGLLVAGLTVAIAATIQRHSRST